MSRWLFGLVLIVATTLAYQPAWRGGLIWDDDLYLKDAKAKTLTDVWIRPPTTQQYHPLIGTVFWVENKLWDDSMLGHHLVNILLHAFSALLLFKILERLEIPGAWLAAAVFALHPVQVESVAWLVELKNTLSGFFFFAAIYVYLQFDQSRNKWAYLLALLFFLLGLLAKTIVAVFPLVILIILWWRRGRIEWRRDLVPLSPFFPLAAISGILTAWMEQHFAAGGKIHFDYSMLERTLISGRLFWFYLGKVLWPANLIMLYPPWVVDASLSWLYLFPIAVLGLFVLLWAIRRRSRAPLAGFLYFLVVLFPLLAFSNQSFYMSERWEQTSIFRADHFQYLAIPGIVVLICAAVAWLWDRSKQPAKIAIACATFVGLLSLTGLTWSASHNYRDAETCYRAVLSKNPQSALAHNNLAGALMDRGAVDEAIFHYRKAIELRPQYQMANYNLGAALVQKGELDEATQRLKWVLRDNPNDPRAYFTLANALVKQGNQNDAIAYYGRALRLVPDFPDAHTNLANLMLERGNAAGALEHYREVVRLQPNNPQAHYNLAVGLVRNGEPEPAISELRVALQLDPNYPDAAPLLEQLLAQKP
jgi:protein O-mannosyl-transferase